MENLIDPALLDRRVSIHLVGVGGNGAQMAACLARLDIAMKALARDGEVLGTVPTDLIPDLLRVDERCDVYVAEESGHIAGFGVAAKLTLVR